MTVDYSSIPIKGNFNIAVHQLTKKGLSNG